MGAGPPSGGRERQLAGLASYSWTAPYLVVLVRNKERRQITKKRGSSPWVEKRNRNRTVDFHRPKSENVHVRCFFFFPLLEARPGCASRKRLLLSGAD